jgi:tetratricopeptide (TPR) repeat protein
MRYRTLLWFLILLHGFSTAPAETGSRNISPEELLAGTALDLGPDPPAIVSSNEAMALSDEMREFLENNVGKRAGLSVKVKQLADAIFSEKVFGLAYDEATRTAAETFSARRGNCLSFTFMFVSMARGVGLDARFQEVDIPPEWTFAKETYILNRHVNIYVDQGWPPPKVVDFFISDFKSDYDTRIISDQRALAHFFNNLGAELMQHGDVPGAFYAFRKALAENDRSFAPAWDSLETLYGRMGHFYHAEASFLQALAADRSDLTAMTNLTALYDRLGEPKLASRYRKKVISHRMRNPYYRFQLARAAYHLEDYDLAINHLKFALQKGKKDDRFCALLGLVYLQMGDEKKSRHWMARAEKYADTEAMKSTYSSKIDRLISASSR